MPYIPLRSHIGSSTSFVRTSTGRGRRIRNSKASETLLKSVNLSTLTYGDELRKMIAKKNHKYEHPR